jgi:hypothetical protein
VDRFNHGPAGLVLAAPRDPVRDSIRKMLDVRAGFDDGA